MVNYLGTVDNPNLFRDFITDEDRNILSVPMQSVSSDEPVVVADAESPDERALRMNVSRDAITSYLGNRTEAMPSYSEPVVEDLLPAGQIPQSHFDAQAQQPIPMGQEPLPGTNDPWYSRIAGTVKNILGLGGVGLSSLAEPAGSQRTVMQDWADKFSTSPFLAMARNERFDRMREQANKNLALEAAMNRQGSQAAPVQIYRQFLGELGYDNPNLTPEQRGEIEQTAYDKTLEFLQASRSNINIGGEAGPKWMSDVNKKRYEDLSSAADNSAMTEAMADELIKGIESGEFVTGGGDLGAAAISVANALGLSSDAQQRYSALFNSFSMERRKNLLSSFKGAISNKEQDIITQAIGSLGSSAQSNLTFLKLAKLSARLARESQEKFDELAGLGLTDSQINTRFNAYLRDRASKTAAEVAQIMGSSGAGSREGSTSGEGRLLNYR